MSDVLRDLTALFGTMPDDEKLEADKLLARELQAKWLPNAGPQTQAYYSKADLLLYGGAAGGGKGLSLDTLLPGPSGFVRMGDVRVGDVLFDQDGDFCTVTAATGINNRPCFEVEFDDGSVIVADDVHRWLTLTYREREKIKKRDPEWLAAQRAVRKSRAVAVSQKPWVSANVALRNREREHAYLPPPVPSIRDTAAIAATLTVRNGMALNHSIDVCGPIAGPIMPLPVDPYLLGLWLGDGISRTGRIGMLVEDWAEVLPHVGSEIVSRTDARSPRGTKPYDDIVFKGLTTALRGLGLLDNKHIPAVYLRASPEQRRELLRGLLDTDGSCSAGGGKIEVAFSNRRLAEDTAELVCSLGIKTTVSTKRLSAQSDAWADSHRMSFRAPFPAFKLPRKLQRQKVDGLRDTTRRRYITAVRPIDSVPTRCIAVDSSSRTYLVGRSFIPTHNTDLLIGLALHEHQRSVFFRRAYVDLRGFEERLIEIRGSRAGYNASDMVLHDEQGRVIEFGALEKPDSEKSWQGRPHDLVGFDEGAQLSETKVRFVLGWLRSATPGQRTRAIIASNPPLGGEGDWLVTWFAPWLDPLFPVPAANGELRWCVTSADGPPVWVPGPGHYVLEGELNLPRPATPEEKAADDAGKVVEGLGEALEATSRTFIPARLDDNPFLRGTGYRAKLQGLPEPMRSQLIKGDFLAGKQDDAWQVIPSAWIAAAQARWKEKPGHLRMVSLGVDPSGSGPDDTVIAPLYSGNHFDHLVKVQGLDKSDGAAVGAVIIKTLRDRANINIDTTGGWGGGAITHLMGAAGIPSAQIHRVVFSASTGMRSKDGVFTMLNERAGLWWAMREALDPESGMNISLPPDRRLAAQLGAPKWKLRGTAVVVEQKEEVRKRLGTSTDDADAVIVAWHRRDKLALSTKPAARRDVA